MHQTLSGVRQQLRVLLVHIGRRALGYCVKLEIAIDEGQLKAVNEAITKVMPTRGYELTKAQALCWLFDEPVDWEHLKEIGLAKVSTIIAFTNIIYLQYVSTCMHIDARMVFSTCITLSTG